jgi:hypothetical protein
LTPPASCRRFSSSLILTNFVSRAIAHDDKVGEARLRDEVRDDGPPWEMTYR